MPEKATVFLLCAAVLMVSLRLGYCNSDRHTRPPSKREKLIDSPAELASALRNISSGIDALKKNLWFFSKWVLKTLRKEIGAVKSKLANFETTNKYIHLITHFDVVNGSQEKMYFVTKTEEPFDIREADFFCGVFGGYLAEIDDAEEYKFIVNFLKKVDGYEVMTGGYDIDKERHWVYWHSGQPVKYSHWSEGNPNNYRGIEDCMEINLHRGGFNDLDCKSKRKFLCET
ncbi:collectin-10 [Elysia marginata]|uniref:Collectin-10 n=1 Tax=Elysia marginata TaxID=1093978 RepID=A0AAV4FYH2_9GAST|nr:collectin-10 [Elysia marginata]